MKFKNCICVRTCYLVGFVVVLLVSRGFYLRGIASVFYDTALWKHYSVTVLVSSNLVIVITNTLRSCSFFRSESMSGILMQLSLSSFDTIIHSSRRVLFDNHCSSSGNCVTVHLCSFSYFFSQPLSFYFSILVTSQQGLCRTV